MKLYEIDPSLIDGKPLPAEFTDTVYSPAQLMERLGYSDESEFWLHYRSGLIPAGVWLPTDQPIVCWDRELIERWVAAGTPVPAELLIHQHTVIRRLIDAVENTLPAQPLRANERN